MKGNYKQIESFLKSTKIAIVGVSRTKEKFGNQVMEQLLKIGYEVVPVHREITEINGLQVVSTISELPDDVQALCLIVPKTATDALLREALLKGIKHIWIQQFSDGPETPNIIKESSANIITGRCVFMYTKPEGMHRFHERVNKLFGTYAR
jgi:predicted CoA-binding protein